MTTPAATDEGPTVVGLDTSLTGTGIASSRGWCEVVGYTGRTKRDTITGLPVPERLVALEDLAARIMLATGQPDLAVLELPAPSRSGGGAHERAWLWWEVYRRLTARDVPVGLVSISQRMLYATGSGRADKLQIVDAVARRWPAWATAGNDNAADAVVLMAAGRDWAGHPVATVPKTHRAAIDRITWPHAAGRITATGGTRS